MADSSDVVQHCCVPANFRSKMQITGIEANRNGHSQFIDQNDVQLYYDYGTKRTRTETKVALPNGIQFLHTEIADFAKEVAFKLDGNVCHRERMNTSMQEQCIQAHAILVSSGRIGSANNSINIQTWRYTIPGTNIINYRMVSAHGLGACTPIFQSAMGLTSATEFSSMSYLIYDVAQQQTPDELFKPPSNLCPAQ